MTGDADTTPHPSLYPLSRRRGAALGVACCRSLGQASLGRGRLAAATIPLSWCKKNCGSASEAVLHGHGFRGSAVRHTAHRSHRTCFFSPLFSLLMAKSRVCEQLCVSASQVYFRYTLLQTCTQGCPRHGAFLWFHARGFRVGRRGPCHWGRRSL